MSSFQIILKKNRAIVQGQVTPMSAVWMCTKSNALKRSCISLLPATLMIQSKSMATQLSHYKPMRHFSGLKGNKVRVRPNFELILSMSLLHVSACLKRIGSTATEKKWKHRFLSRSRAAHSVISIWVWPKFEPIHSFMQVLITCKYQKEQIKTMEKKWISHSPIMSLCGHF